MGYAEPPRQDPGISRAMVSIVKREFHEVKKKKFIGRQVLPWQHEGPRPICHPRMRRILVSNMVRSARTGLEELSTVMLWLVSYAFLLRLPSEVRAMCA